MNYQCEQSSIRRALDQERQALEEERQAKEVAV